MTSSAFLTCRRLIGGCTGTTWEEPFLNERFETYRLEKLDDNMQQESS
jgi:hypothetical protein